MLKLMAYNYNTVCDSHGCSNRAQVSIGMPHENPGMRHNICNECLQAIIDHAPVEMVLKRPDLDKALDIKASEMSKELAKQVIKDTIAPNELEKAVLSMESSITPITAGYQMDYSRFNVRELAQLAKSRGLVGYSDLKRDELVALLESSI